MSCALPRSDRPALVSDSGCAQVLRYSKSAYALSNGLGFGAAPAAAFFSSHWHTPVSIVVRQAEPLHAICATHTE